jgi:hypothetical protein
LVRETSLDPDRDFFVRLTSFSLGLAEAPTELGKLLREQQPVAGMSGTVNRTAVRQFRMPGYPRALITTELLQEGEDLHLFCSRI